MQSSPFRLLAAALIGAATLCHAGEPKKLLVVTVTTGFRHSSIPVSERVLARLAEQTGEFTLEFARQPDDKPEAPRAPRPPAPDAAPETHAAHAAAAERYEAARTAYEAALADWNRRLAEALRPLAPESLAAFDGVIFANTSGDLPIPDPEAFLAWIQSGKAFIGIHAASDTFHSWPAYREMLGGQFLRHGPQAAATLHNCDPTHPATAHPGPAWTIALEEFYEFKNYEAAKVRELLRLDRHPNTQTPGHYPLAWRRDYGQGRVFYTALGHREDLWDADPALKNRKNSPETSLAFQQHLLGGIRWALGIPAPDRNHAPPPEP